VSIVLPISEGTPSPRDKAKTRTRSSAVNRLG